jgi:hypothetical protein
MRDKPTAIITCVDYSDILELTLPTILPHVSGVCVLTSNTDLETDDLAEKLGVDCMRTDSFYENGAYFNKGLALNRAIEALRPEGWLMLLDADIAFPRVVDWSPCRPGNLYSCRRKAWFHVGSYRRSQNREDWSDLMEMCDNEMGGYMHLFHTNDGALGDYPWLSDQWVHAGGYDTEFIVRWPATRHVYLPWYVLHIGEPCQHWYGRVPYPSRDYMMKKMWGNRYRYGDYRKERLDEKPITLRDIRDRQPDT